MVYITDKGSLKNACIMRIHGSTETTSIVVRDPYGIALDEDGNVYATDCSSHRFLMFEENLNFKEQVGAGRQKPQDDQFSYPHGVAVIGEMVYVCDHGNCRVKVYSQKLDLLYSFGERKKEDVFEEQNLYGPVDIAGDSQGGLYVADDKKNAIVKFRLREKGLLQPDFVRNMVHKSLKMPTGLTVDSYDYIYVIDKLSKCIIVFNPTGSSLDVYDIKCMLAPQAICCVQGPEGSSVFYVSDMDSEVNVWKCNMKYS